MQKFLHLAAQFVLEQAPEPHEVTVVMPSRRAAVFFRKAMAELSEKIILAPRILSIEDLIMEVSGLETDSQAALFFKLFEAYRESLAEAEEFEDFNKWGRLLLQDFNEIDRHLVKPQELFEYLGDLKRIEHWELELGESSTMAKNYLALWPKLAVVYENFKDRLLSDGLAYQGLAYRKFYESVAAETKGLQDRYGHFFFLGFNALNRAEEEAFLILFDSGLADFYWDVDHYYLKNPKHEAGLFLRKSPLYKRLAEAGKLFGEHQKLKNGPRLIRSIAVSGKNLQAYIANQELASVNGPAESETALVLADEELLPGILHNLNPTIDSFNLSMGLSLKNSPLAGFFELLLDFALESERSNRKDKKGHPRFNHKKWNALLSHFILKRLPVDQVQVLEQTRQQLIDENALYRSMHELEISAALEPIPVALFFGQLSPGPFFGHLARFCLDFHHSVDQDKYLHETLYGFYQAFRQLEDLITKFPYLERFEHALSFYRDLLSDLSMDLKGEPLSGLQVMGMLETRLLDFRKLVICSLNEGVLPKGRSENSLLPFDVKRKFGLPTYLEKDAVYAYHFYRLLHQAEEVSLLYSTSDSALGQAEPSRFIRQLMLEWPQNNRQVTIEHYHATGQAESAGLKADRIEKSAAVMQRLKEMAEAGLSPTALIQYLKDPVIFYYERVLGLRPEDEIQEELELPLQGTALHHCLEKYYSQADPQEPEARIPRNPSPEDPIFSKSLSEYKSDLRQELLQLVPGAELDQGPNYLILETMSQMLQSFLKEEQKELQKREDWEVLATEKNLRGTISLKSGLEVHLKGQADRIDREGDLIRILDYKSGGKAKGEYQISKDLDFEAFLKKPYALQLPLYAYLYYRSHPECSTVEAAILSLRKTSENPIKMKLSSIERISVATVESFEDHLKAILEELYDPNIPFEKRP